MPHVLFLEYPKCSTCKKAKKWLDDNGVAYEARHIVQDNPTDVELARWVAASGLAFRRFFNTSGMRYRELNVKARLDAGMSEADAIRLLASDGMLVKRPVLVIDGGAGGVLVGFKEDAWREALRMDAKRG